MIVNDEEDSDTVGRDPSKATDKVNRCDRPRIINSNELLRGCRELWIEHGDNMYRLRLTSAGKLYLTK